MKSVSQKEVYGVYFTREAVLGVLSSVVICPFRLGVGWGTASVRMPSPYSRPMDQSEKEGNSIPP